MNEITEIRGISYLCSVVSHFDSSFKFYKDAYEKERNHLEQSSSENNSF